MNPFSPTAIARVSESAADFFTVGTTAAQIAVSALSDMLDQDAEPPHRPSGRPSVMALVGDHGTGKTHLCVELIRHARRRSPGRVQAFYLDAPAATFLALHRQFTEALSQAEITAAVRSLPDSSPDALQDAGVRDPDLALCLSLLGDPEHADAAWAWACGYPPTAPLTGRGVTRAVFREEVGIQVMADLATVLRLAGSRVVLVVDEIEKILSASSRSNAAAAAAFRAFLDAFAPTGAIIILSGVSDWLQVLDEDVRRRVGRTIVTMSSMSAADTIDFIRKTQDRALGTPTLAPFSEQTAEYLTQLADGVPRRIARICYQLYRRASELGTRVSYAMVRDVHTYFDLISTQEVRGEIGRILESEGLSPARDHLLGDVADLPVDFWLPVGDDRSGCCLLLSEGVLKLEDAEALIRRADAVRDVTRLVEIQLVVVGVLPLEFASRLTAGFGTKPVVYEPLSFAADLSAAVRAMLRRLEAAVGIDPLTSVSNRLEQMSRQHTSSQRSIEQLTDHLDEIRMTFDQHLASLQRNVAEMAGNRGPRTTAKESATAISLPGLPDRVESLFDGALATLDGVGRMGTMFRDTFRSAGRGALHADATRLSVRSMVRSPEVLPALGVTVLLREMVGTFRSEVATWLSRSSTSAGPHDIAALDALCRTYESEFEEVPLFQLDGLGELAARRSGHVDTVGQLAWSKQRLKIRETLERLAENVQAESLRAIAAQRPD